MTAKVHRGDPFPPLHPAEVTADRLRAAVDYWSAYFDGEQRDWVGIIIHTLDEIAERRIPPRRPHREETGDNRNRP